MLFETIFSVANLLIVPAWVLLLFAPKKSITQKLVYSYIYPLIFAIMYILFIVWGMAENSQVEGSGMDSMDALRIAFTSNKVLLAAWIHYLVFDLLVGIWINKKSIKSETPHWLRGVFLLFTFLFGPLGFTLFLLYHKLVLKRDVA